MDEGFEMEPLYADCNTCVICARVCKKKYYPANCKAEKFPKPKKKLHYILNKLQIPYDKVFPLTLCNACKGALDVAYRFIKKIWATRASFKVNDTCVICARACEKNYYSADSNDETFSFILTKLQIPYDKILPLTLCNACKGDLDVVNRFMNKLETTRASFKAKNILPAHGTSDLFNRSSYDDGGFKWAEIDASSLQNCLKDKTKTHAERLTFNAKRLILNPNLQPIRCCGCKKALCTNEQVQDHSEKYHRRDRISNGQVIKSKPYECLVCFQRFQFQRKFRQHYRKMYVKQLLHKIPSINDQIDVMRQSVRKCCICREKFDSIELAISHVTKNHTSQADNIKSGNKYECEICGGRFKTRKELMVHEQRPFREHRFKCSNCQMTFEFEQTLIDHERSHNDIRPYKCATCLKRFTRKSNYFKHMRYHLVPNGQFTCEVKGCGKMFKRKRTLKVHKEKHNIGWTST